MSSHTANDSETPSAVLVRMKETIAQQSMAKPDTPVLLMVSGGSDSTALAYAAAQLHADGDIGEVAILHVNHLLRGDEADEDARFVTQLAEVLDIPLFSVEVDVAQTAQLERANVEAVARRERYLAANEALASLCRHAAMPLSEGRIFTAHTADDRVENFYMRSIVGTGPGGFRSMRYRNGPIVRPLMDVSHNDLQTFIQAREQAGKPMACDETGALWREDATNAHTDRFRAYVRHEIVPRAKERNPQLLEVLGRTMNLIADEDDMLDAWVDDLIEQHVIWIEQESGNVADYTAGCVLAPEFKNSPVPLQRRVVLRVLQNILGRDARIDTASIDAILRGETANIQGDLAVSSNKHGVRVEPMAAYRARRKRS